jgi:hypothetical protein
MLTIGFFGTLAIAAVLLWKQGILGDAFYWIFTNHSIPHVFWTKGLLITLAFVGACLLLVFGAVNSYRDGHAIWAGKTAERTAIVGLIVASAIGAAAGARFYPHYYIQLIPPLALLAAPYFARLCSGSVRRVHWWQRPIVIYAWLGLTVVGFTIAHWEGQAHARQLTQAGRYLLDHSAPSDRVFVWGQAPNIYLDAHRRPASRFVVTFPLTGYIFGGLTGVDTHDWIVAGAWTKLQQDFATHPPVYIVDVQAPEKNAQYPIHNFPFLAQLLSQKYRPVARTSEGVIYRLR